jgi:hypothetical protein
MDNDTVSSKFLGIISTIRGFRLIVIYNPVRALDLYSKLVHATTDDLPVNSRENKVIVARYTKYQACLN